MSEVGNKALAWAALKQTRNPEFVSIRYGFPVEDLRKALEKLPNEEPMFRRLAKPSAAPRSKLFDRPRDLLPETVSRERIPGEDDDKE